MTNTSSLASVCRIRAAGQWLIAAVLLWTATGCSRQIELGQVSGRVLLDGQPIAGAQVEFIPEKAAVTETNLLMSVGVIDEAGRCALPASRLPSNYASAGRTPLRTKVAAGEQSLDLKLTSTSQGPQ